MEAERPKRRARKSKSKSESESESTSEPDPDPDPNAVAAVGGYFDDEGGALENLSAEDAQKVADYTRAKNRREAAARGGVPSERVVEHPTTDAQRRELEALKSQQSRLPRSKRRNARGSSNSGARRAPRTVSSVAPTETATDSDSATTPRRRVSRRRRRRTTRRDQRRRRRSRRRVVTARGNVAPARATIGLPSISWRTWTASLRFATRTRARISTSPRGSTRDRRMAI